MAFHCGTILADGSECLHESRRKALACTKRLDMVNLNNELIQCRQTVKEMGETVADLEERSQGLEKTAEELKTALDSAAQKLGEVRKAHAAEIEEIQQAAADLVQEAVGTEEDEEDEK